ncbi:hypothetical protein [Bdellovibrio sp. HCB288]|uniref:Acb2/Tad1 domain-containing protein n=1 Tax=Bdellovibrio sp. HCB288 TaxID=3394355 RepID=UPI0039B5CFB2
MKSKTFSYVKYDEQATAKSEEIKGLCEQLETKIQGLGAGRYQSLALTHLEIAFAMCGKALRDIQIQRDSQTEHVAERTNE